MDRPPLRPGEIGQIMPETWRFLFNWLLWHMGIFYQSQDSDDLASVVFVENLRSNASRWVFIRELA